MIGASVRGPDETRARHASRTRQVLLAAYLAVCALALVWPGYAWLGSTIEPYVLGLPFSLVWNVAWVLLTFLVLLAYHLTGARSER